MVEDIFTTIGDALGGGDGGGVFDMPHDPHHGHHGHHKPHGGDWDILPWLFDSGADSAEQRTKSPSKGGFAERVRSMPIRPRMLIARGFGEAASLAAAPIAMVVVDKALHQPYEDLKNRIAQKIILPNLDKWDATLAGLKSLDPPHEREERLALSKPEQARKIADLVVDQFGVKFGASVIGQLLTQDYFIHKFGAHVTSRQNAIAVFADRGVQIGSTVLLNTVAADQAVAVQRSLINVLQRAGMSEEKAEEWANFGVNFTLPNALAYLFSVELLTRMSKKI